MLCGNIRHRHRHRVHPYSIRCRSFLFYWSSGPGTDPGRYTVQRAARNNGIAAKSENPNSGPRKISDNGTTGITENRKNRLTGCVNIVNLTFASITTHQRRYFFCGFHDTTGNGRNGGNGICHHLDEYFEDRRDYLRELEEDA